jgi:hypothetical protein
MQAEREIAATSRFVPDSPNLAPVPLTVPGAPRLSAGEVDAMEHYPHVEGMATKATAAIASGAEATMSTDLGDPQAQAALLTATLEAMGKMIPGVYPTSSQSQ